MEGCDKILLYDHRKLVFNKKSSSFWDNDILLFYVLGESPVDRCERVDVGSVTGWDYSQCEPDSTEPVLPVPAVWLQNLEQQWISCQNW